MDRPNTAPSGLSPLSLARWLALFVFALSASAVGCAGTHAVRGQVVHPAEVPIRGFPRVWVIGGESLAEQRFADALVAHLTGDADIRVVPLRDLEPARASGRIPPATVVVLPRLVFQDSSATRWTSRPQTICGATGCYTSRRSYQYLVPVLAANLIVTVYDGPTATVQQVIHLETREEERTPDAMRTRATRTLAELFGVMVDQQVEEVEVILLEVELPEVQGAIARIDGGDWSGGRALLEEAVQAARTLAPEDHARVLYDLGMARLYAPRAPGEADAHFRAASVALEEAIALDPQERYQEALADVAVHRRRYEEVRQQHAAAEQNYRVGSQVPEPPAAYHRAPEPIPNVAPAPAPVSEPDSSPESE